MHPESNKKSNKKGKETKPSVILPAGPSSTLKRPQITKKEEGSEAAGRLATTRHGTDDKIPDHEQKKEVVTDADKIDQEPNISIARPPTSTFNPGIVAKIFGPGSLPANNNPSQSHSASVDDTQLHQQSLVPFTAFFEAKSTLSAPIANIFLQTSGPPVAATFPSSPSYSPHREQTARVPYIPNTRMS